MQLDTSPACPPLLLPLKLALPLKFSVCGCKARVPSCEPASKLTVQWWAQAGNNRGKFIRDFFSGTPCTTTLEDKFPKQVLWGSICSENIIFLSSYLQTALLFKLTCMLVLLYCSSAPHSFDHQHQDLRIDQNMSYHYTGLHKLLGQHQHHHHHLHANELIHATGLSRPEAPPVADSVFGIQAKEPSLSSSSSSSLSLPSTMLSLSS